MAEPGYKPARLAPEYMLLTTKAYWLYVCFLNLCPYLFMDGRTDGSNPFVSCSVVDRGLGEGGSKPKSCTNFLRGLREVTLAVWAVK